MVRILICYGTTEGHTKKVAEYIADKVREQDIHVELHNVTATGSGQVEQTYDGVFVGASVHQAKHQPAVKQFVANNAELLRSVPSVFFSVSLEASLPGEEHQAEAEGYIEKFLQEADWAPDERWSVAGALRYTEHDFLKRLLMKLIAKRKGQSTDTSTDHEYTDWEELDGKIKRFLKRTYHSA